jgi:hypothetical protein
MRIAILGLPLRTCGRRSLIRSMGILHLRIVLILLIMTACARQRRVLETTCDIRMICAGIVVVNRFLAGFPSSK